MLKLTYEKVRNPQFMQAMAKLSHSPSFKDPKAAYNIARIIARLEIETKGAQELFIKLLKQYALLDDKKEFVASNGPGTYQIPPEKLDEWKLKLDEFEKIEFDIDRRHIKMDDMANAGLSPSEMHALEPIIDHEDCDKEVEAAPAVGMPQIKTAPLSGIPKAVPPQPAAKH